jgi:hypothetical protein
MQATASNHHNISTFTPTLSEGRTGEAWEPSQTNNAISPPPQIKCLSVFTLLPLFSNYSAVPRCLSARSGLKYCHEQVEWIKQEKMAIVCKK